MAKEYIEREALIEVINHFTNKSICESNISGFPKDFYEMGKDHVIDYIKFMPAADVVEVEVRRGEWVDNHCSECGEMPMGDEIFERIDWTPPKFSWFMDYCPLCGAKMDGERKEK